MRKYRQVASNKSYLGAIGSGKSQVKADGLISQPKFGVNASIKIPSNISINLNGYTSSRYNYEVK